MGSVPCHPSRTEVVAARLIDFIVYRADVLTLKGISYRLFTAPASLQNRVLRRWLSTSKSLGGFRPFLRLEFGLEPRLTEEY